MPQVASVRLRYTAQDYWFDPAGIDIQEGDHVVVETSKGQEVGICTKPLFEMEESEITKPLKPVVRVATEEDLKHADEVSARGQEALAVFHDLVEKNGLDMNPSEVVFSFDETHATFYFTSDGRVDFRGLVRDLSSAFHVRVDMRQIGPRDEARMLGGLGHCGEELCCARLGGEFQPVSIRMAKEQDLPLNPTKISGLCGRLMCCLRYEFEAYKDFKGRAPKKNALIETPAGMGKVVEFDTPREIIHLRMEDGSSLKVPLSYMDTGDKTPREGERVRPCHVSQDMFDELMEELNNDSNLAMMGEKLFSDNPDLADTTAEGGSIERVHRRKRGTESGSRRRSDGQSGGRKKQEDSGRKPRRRSSSSSSSAAAQPRNERKRRRSVSATDGTEIAHGSDDRSDSGSQSKRPRPGQHSSSISGDGSKRTGQGSDSPKKDRSSQGGQRRRKRRSGSGNRSASKPKE